ncbi:hypothetical protein BUALT_Bualt19G0023800 [Buddleja alternifolia]|uniref:Hyaluronan/mRNA-binding protein domain-containing protein n=1 Tax=Buddleja alternifolia TaxID=168488 RepID=A0AAV6W8W1_9LAMI|nr:hypothetical protein BUALT_Bualt19G0023800 [Buddleja alternifolia]
MSTVNPFDLLGDDDTGDLSQLLAAQQLKIEPKKTLAASAKPGAAAANKPAAQPKLPSKPLPPTQAVYIFSGLVCGGYGDAKSESARGGRGGRGYGRGRGGDGGSYRDFSRNENSHGNREISDGQSAPDEADAGRSYERRGGYVGPRGPFRGGRRGGFSNGEAGEGDLDRPRRPFDRRSGTGHGYETKREGSGRGNWGTQSDELAPVAEEVVNDGEKSLNAEKPSGEENAATDGDKEAATNEVEEKEPESKEMTLEEYEKVLEEKRKALQTLKTEGRKVDVKEFEAMQQLSNKKTGDEIFIKLGSEKDKKKELAEKEERAKKSVSINEFLKPAEGERFYNPGGRGRGRGRGSRGGYSGGSEMSNVRAPAIEDPGQFPTLGGK